MGHFSAGEDHLVAALSGANPLNLLMASPLSSARGKGGQGGNVLEARRGNETVTLCRRLLGDNLSPGHLPINLFSLYDSPFLHSCDHPKGYPVVWSENTGIIAKNLKVHRSTSKYQNVPQRI